MKNKRRGDYILSNDNIGRTRNEVAATEMRVLFPTLAYHCSDLRVKIDQVEHVE